MPNHRLACWSVSYLTAPSGNANGLTVQANSCVVLCTLGRVNTPLRLWLSLEKWHSTDEQRLESFLVTRLEVGAFVQVDLLNPNGSMIYTYKRVVCVCWFVCLLFIGHTTFVHFAALPPSGREQEPSSRAAPRARASMNSESTRAHAVQLLNENIAALMPFKNKTVRPSACCRIRDCRDFQKENQHATSQVQFTVCLLLECLLFESYWIVFCTNRVCWPPWNHGEPGDLPSLRRRG